MFDAIAVAATMAPTVATWRPRLDERMDRVDGELGRASGRALAVGHTALDRYAADERYPRRAATTSRGSGCEMDFELR